jgi:hypothetical protein
MLNKNQERELAYVVQIDEIVPIEGADRVEVAKVGGWRVMVRKGQFKAGDPAIYFEIDSKVPETEAFEFLAQKHYKVKTQKYFKGTVISQGLLMAAEDFGWTVRDYFIVDDKGYAHGANDQDSMFLTKKLGVTYYEAEDNKRKASSADKYQKMAQRMGKKFAKFPYRNLMRHTWGKKLLYLFYGRKGDKKNGWPEWVKKTDEERVQNMPWILEDKNPWIATEKIDGTSTTFTMKRGKRGKNDVYVCSRNVVFDTPDKACFYDKNVYFEMFEKYNIKDVLTQLLDENPKAEWVTIQGETYGNTVQKRDYSLEGRDFAAFNLIFSNTGRVGTVEMNKILTAKGVPCVPILSTEFILPDTVDELLDAATGNSAVDGKPREGIVFRSPDGERSFKAVSNSFLLKYHG